MRTCWLQEHAVAVCVGVVLMFCGRIVLADEKPPQKIDDLLQKRLALLEQVQRTLMSNYGSKDYGNKRGLMAEVHEATVELLNARLELAKSPKDRIKIFEDMLTTAQELERISSQLNRTGEARQVEPLQAKALVLEFQIALERLKKNPGQPTAGR
jgi:uncharacterized membrane protein YccC